MDSKTQKFAIEKLNNIILLINNINMDTSYYLCEELVIFLEKYENYLSDDDIKRAEDAIQWVKGWNSFNNMQE